MRSSTTSVTNLYARVQMHALFKLLFVMSDIVLSFWLGIAAIFQVMPVLLFICKERHCYCVFSRTDLPQLDSRNVVCCFLTTVCQQGSNKIIETLCFSEAAWLFLLLRKRAKSSYSAETFLHQSCKTSTFATKETSLFSIAEDSVKFTKSAN